MTTWSQREEEVWGGVPASKHAPRVMSSRAMTAGAEPGPQAADILMPNLEDNREQKNGSRCHHAAVERNTAMMHLYTDNTDKKMP